MVWTQSKHSRPLFSLLVLDNLWKIYSAFRDSSVDKIKDIAAFLKIPIYSNVKNLSVRDLMSKWLPLRNCLFDVLLESGISPKASQMLRIPKLFEEYFNDLDVPNLTENFHNDSINEQKLLTSEVNATKLELTQCSPSSNLIFVYISKIQTFECDKSVIYENGIPVANIRGKVVNEDIREKQRLEAIRLRLARQSLEKGEKTQSTANDPPLVAISKGSSCNESAISDEKPAETTKTVTIGFARVYSGTIVPNQQLNLAISSGPTQQTTITKIYRILGTDLKPLDSASAGEVVGLEISSGVYPNTIITSLADPPRIKFFTLPTPILYVSLEPKDPSEIPLFTKAVEEMKRCDLSITVKGVGNGEFVLGCSGAVHLDKCLFDLETVYKCPPVTVGESAVPFRESIIPEPGPKSYLSFIEEQNIESQELGEVVARRGGCFVKLRVMPLSPRISAVLDGFRNRPMTDLKESLLGAAAATEEKNMWSGNADRIWAIYPPKSPSNILINEIPKSSQSFLSRNNNVEYESAIYAGFIQAMQAGPLCNEPCLNCAVIINDVGIDVDDVASALAASQITNLVRDACKQGFMKWSTRLYLAMYSCELLATPEILGKLYAVVAKRRGRVVSEEMRDSQFFVVKSLVPVVESFGFADDLRKKTAGSANPQLVFYGYERLDLDPFWVPTTQEELEDFGSKADKENVARMYMENVRKQKGLFVEQKVVEHAEKQRTLRIK